jgi:hypothetical protein
MESGFKKKERLGSRRGTILEEKRTSGRGDKRGYGGGGNQSTLYTYIKCHNEATIL